ncbi:MAG: extracellular solute-binding protein, partial [Victivallales bacterium]
MKRFSNASTVILSLIALVIAALLYPRAAHSYKGKERIVLWGPVWLGDSMRLVAEKFEKQYPEYKVEIGSATVRDVTGDPTRFLLGVAGNVPPDLIYFDRFAIVEWASRGAFTDLGGYVANDRGVKDGIFEENFIPNAWNECKYKDVIYAIPNSCDTRAMYYNKDALIRAGYVYSGNDPEVVSGKCRAGDARPPVTWEELCRKLVDSDAKVANDGTVTVSPDEIDIVAAGAKPGDVVAVISATAQGRVFRARIAEIVGKNSLKLDFEKEQPANLKAVPDYCTGACRIKIFDQNSYIVKLTRFDSASGTIRKAGFIPFFGNSWLYMYGWLNGGEYMTADGSKCTLNDPRIVEALQFLTDMYDSLGGIENAMIFQNSNPTNMLDLFLDGSVAMKIDGDWFMPTISAFKPNLSFGLCPAPIPEARLKAGGRSCGWLGGFAYAIPSTAKKKDASWKLLRWLCSMEANRTVSEFEDSVSKSKGQIYFPRMHPDVRYTEFLQKEYIDKSPAISDDLKHTYSVYKDLLPDSRFRPVTPIGQKLWNEQVRAAENAIAHVMSPQDSLDYGTDQVQIALDRVLHPPTGPEIPWGKLIGLYCFSILVFISGMVLWQRSRKYAPRSIRSRWYEGYICASPWLIGFFTFGAGPIVFSIIISFSHYDVLNPAKFIGFDNYVNLFHDPIFWKSLQNTAFMIISVPISLLAGLGLAIFLNNNVKGMQFYRTLFYLPAIVPAVAAFILWMKILDPNIGLLNQMLRGIGVSDPPSWLTSPLWAKPSIILMGLWGVGGGMIIWLAGLKNISESLYEAAAIDGANRWQQFRHITLPMLTPYIFFNLVMGMIGV